jgi:hypothetical protein
MTVGGRTIIIMTCFSLINLITSKSIRHIEGSLHSHLTVPDGSLRVIKNIFTLSMRLFI